jgi:hypothetical protein
MGYCLKPFRESADNHYCRLFAPSRLPADQDRYREALMALGSAMIIDINVFISLYWIRASKFSKI